MVRSSVASEQTPLLTVHLSVTLVPAVTPVMVEVGEEGEVIVAEPVIMVHVPLPKVDALAAIVKVEVLHNV